MRMNTKYFRDGATFLNGSCVVTVEYPPLPSGRISARVKFGNQSRYFVVWFLPFHETLIRADCLSANAVLQAGQTGQVIRIHVWL